MSTSYKSLTMHPPIHPPLYWLATPTSMHQSTPLTHPTPHNEHTACWNTAECSGEYPALQVPCTIVHRLMLRLIWGEGGIQSPWGSSLFCSYLYDYMWHVLILTTMRFPCACGLMKQLNEGWGGMLVQPKGLRGPTEVVSDAERECQGCPAPRERGNERNLTQSDNGW